VYFVGQTSGKTVNDNDIEVLGKIHAKIIEDCIFILIAFLLQTVEMQCKKMYNKVN